MNIFQSGTKLSAQSGADNQWYKAFVILTEEGYCCVKYASYPEIEWLPLDRLRLTQEFEGYEDAATVESLIQNYANCKNISKPEFTPVAYRTTKEVVKQSEQNYDKSDLFIVKDGTLYAIDASNGNRKALPNSYSKTTQLCYFKGYLYAVNDGYLYKIDTTTGEKIEVKGLSFSNTTFMTASESFIFAIIGGYLYRIDPDKPSKESVGNVGWDRTQAISANK
jgi:outer membrane protein assembly factor BamB